MRAAVRRAPQHARPRRRRRAASGRASRRARPAASRGQRPGSRRAAAKNACGERGAARAAAAARSGARSSSSSAPSARTSRAWISGSGSVPGSGSSSGARRWKSLCGNSKLKNVASAFSNCARARAARSRRGARSRSSRRRSPRRSSSALERLAHALRCRRASAPGCALSTIIARKRFGWSVRISSGITLHGHQAADDALRRRPGVRAPLAASPPTGSADARCAGSSPPRLAEVAGQQARAASPGTS